jgi:hypothetical protein
MLSLFSKAPKITCRQYLLLEASTVGGSTSVFCCKWIKFPTYWRPHDGRMQYPLYSPGTQGRILEIFNFLLGAACWRPPRQKNRFSGISMYTPYATADEAIQQDLRCRKTVGNVLFHRALWAAALI